MGAPKKSLSKMEVNKLVKKILKIHNADQSQLQLSCSPSGVRITGYLIKEGVDGNAGEKESERYEIGLDILDDDIHKDTGS